MNKNKLITPEGTKDYLFEEAIIRNEISNTLSNTFYLRGYHEVITPSIEFLDVFMANQQILPIEKMYKLTDNKGRLMALRPDSTMPIARLSSTRLKNEELPLRLFYNQSVFLVSKSLRGSSDEILQAGIELIGTSNLKSDIEVLVTAVQAIKSLKIDNFSIEIGHIGIFKSLINKIDITQDQKEEIRLLIEAKNYPALNDLLDSLGNSEEISVIKNLPRLFGNKNVFEKAKQIIKSEDTLEYLAYLENIYTDLVSLGLEDKITVDLGIVNRTDYYTGIVFKGYIEGYGEEILSGGRYDSLLKEFGEDMGAIGFGINIDSVVKTFVAKEKAKIKSPAILFYSTEEYQIKALSKMNEKIDEQVICEYSLLSSLEETKAYAKRKLIPMICVVSDSIEYIYII